MKTYKSFIEEGLFDKYINKYAPYEKLIAKFIKLLDDGASPHHIGKDIYNNIYADSFWASRGGTKRYIEAVKDYLLPDKKSENTEYRDEMYIILNLMQGKRAGGRAGVIDTLRKKHTKQEKIRQTKKWQRNNQRVNFVGEDNTTTGVSGNPAGFQPTGKRGKLPYFTCDNESFECITKNGYKSNKNISDWNESNSTTFLVRREGSNDYLKFG